MSLPRGRYATFWAPSGRGEPKSLTVYSQNFHWTRPTFRNVEGLYAAIAELSEPERLAAMRHAIVQ